MPCGGIYPLGKDDDFGKMHGNTAYDSCFHCGKDIKPEDLMWCEEWDCYLHRDCVIEFLKTEEGQVIIAHGHQVVLYFSKESEDADASDTGSN